MKKFNKEIRSQKVRILSRLLKKLLNHKIHKEYKVDYIATNGDQMKIKKSQVLFCFMILILIGGLNCEHKKRSDGVMIRLKRENPTDPGLMKIQVCSENIIHVTATSEKSFPKRSSLMVDKTDWEEVPWSLEEEGNEIVLSTSKVTAKADREKGTIAFYNANGQLILEETAKDSKTITPADVMGEKTYHIQQIFNSSVSEAFYGLGQHQNNIMNYKGHDVDLWQYNIVVAVPFLVSSKNYGILWDNNSRTKFGDIRDYQSLSMLKLYDKEGKEGGLSAEYFEKSNFKSILTSRRESRIEYEFIDVHDTFPENFNINTGSIRWSGEIESSESGIHKFRLYSSNYTKMWLNGELVVNAWRQNWLPWTHLLKMPMEAGKRYPIKIEWIPNGGFIGLKHLGPEKELYKNSLSLYSEVADGIDYYFICGDNLDEVIKGYRTITGKATMMPKWAMGLWQCRQRYQTQEELLSVVKEFRRRKIPLDNIVQDWFYWEEDKWGSHEFDSTRFQDPEGMVRELHDDLNTHIMISVWPKFYVGTKNYEEFKKKGWLYMRNVEQEQKDWVGPGYVSTFYDPYSKGARDLFWKQIDEHLFSKGFDAWWLDCTEPDIQSNLSRNETRLRMHPTAMGSGARYRNTYSLMNSKGVYESQRETKPDQRVFILTRSAFPGQQRYAAATWSGDIAARWYDLKAQISAGLNFCLSGIPYWTTDVGGFSVESRYMDAKGEDLAEWRELMTRWFQFAAFCPLFRVHGEYPYREIFYVAPPDHPAYQSMLYYDRLRYRLMPYIYSLTGMVTQKDYTIMRALVMDFGYDEKVLDIGNQYMFGPSLLINPVTEYKIRKRPLYLPEGTGWYELKSGKYFSGGKTIESPAPYTEIPIYVKEGSIIPFGPELKYSTEKPADPLMLYVYTGADASFELYEDENVNYNYEKGAFSIIPFKYNEKTHTLVIGKREGEFPEMLKERTIHVVWVSKERKIKLDFNIKGDEILRYDGSEKSVKMKSKLLQGQNN
jgi:alpha-D-xyloside xylohydrolase